MSGLRRLMLDLMARLSMRILLPGWLPNDSALFPGLLEGLLLAKKICRRQILQPGKCYKWVRSFD
ncbi:hypothetical protein HanXRQr2_Chr15g0708131 [Helianthus annuus]|uniref:Uncharacterized protein n=1 Tax=Helianthus annuus TaxID=4232 RepID=A0A251SBX1_HELAN|nr:hypothetical protein HanXRQr2_Chr15g0708131 [Helianthus annuus]KAJ0474197.1 hypothetical protein HanHA89_Chr15g0626971 [Helianthus annuus]KAJ0832526.1 hypothetical protein HanPSC8_Chr15g0679751 [Helianthus annuus]